jgi:F0F1-type ATP synthase assembly protein I
MRRLAVSLALVLQVSSIVLCSVLGSLALGVWLDRRFGSAPWLTLILMAIGLGLAVFGTYRLAKRMNE